MTGTEELTPVRPCDRAFKLDDLHVRSDGGGRIVEAYAAVFNSRTEVIDQDGHYREELSPTSFAKTIQTRGATGFGVLFNHGRTIDGTPNPAGTMPIGVPLEVRADERGVYTVTRYLDNPLADQVLDAIKAGAIKAQSFSGRFRKSVRSYPEGKKSGALPLITRQEVEMREYGPAVFAQYTDAAILGTRAAESFMRSVLTMSPDERRTFLESFEGITTLGSSPEPESPRIGIPDGTAEKTAGSARSIPLRDRVRAERNRLHIDRK